MRSVIRTVDRWIFGAYHAAPADLAIFRILYSAYLLLSMVPTALWVDRMPHAFFSPPVGMTALVGGFPPAGVMAALNAGLVVVAGLLLVGWRTPTVSVATGVLLLAIKSVEYSDGKINHDILLVLMPLLLAGSGWGSALSVDARRGAPHPLRPRPSWALALTAFVIGWAMFGAGAIKALTGWLDPATKSTYGYLAANVLVTGREPPLGGPALGWNAPLAWEVADWAAVIMEVGFLLAMLHPRAFRSILAVACLFHLGVWMLFDIPYSAVLMYGAFVAWSPLVARWEWGRRILVPGWAPSPWKAAVAVGAAWCAGAVAVAAGAPLELLLHLHLQEMIILAGAAAGAVHLAHPLVRRLLAAPALPHQPSAAG
jgi:hypothetical protein